MLIPGTRSQQQYDYTYDASGTSTGAAQLILPQRKSTSALFIQNISDTSMYLEIGGARATATLSNGTVASVAVTNGGFGFTRPPRIHFLGGASIGWNMSDGNFLGAGLQGYPAPSNSARAHAVLTGGSVSSIVVDNAGSNYVEAPYVFIINDPDDPFGCASPSATSGILLAANGGNYSSNPTACTTDPVSLYCSASSKAFTVKWIP